MMNCSKLLSCRSGNGRRKQLVPAFVNMLNHKKSSTLLTALLFFYCKGNFSISVQFQNLLHFWAWFLLFLLSVRKCFLSMLLLFLALTFPASFSYFSKLWLHSFFSANIHKRSRLRQLLPFPSISCIVSFKGTVVPTRTDEAESLRRLFTHILLDQRKFLEFRFCELHPQWCYQSTEPANQVLTI